MDELKKKLDELEKRIHIIESVLNNHGESLSRAETNIKDVDGVNRLLVEEWFPRLEDKISALTKRLDRTEVKDEF